MAGRGGSGAALARQLQPRARRGAPVAPEAPGPLALPVPKALAPPRMPGAEVVRGRARFQDDRPAGVTRQRKAGWLGARESSDLRNRAEGEQGRWEENGRAWTLPGFERAFTGKDSSECHGWVGGEETGSRGLRPRHWQIHFYGCWSKMAVSAQGQSQCEPSTEAIRVR